MNNGRKKVGDTIASQTESIQYRTGVFLLPKVVSSSRPPPPVLDETRKARFLQCGILAVKQGNPPQKQGKEGWGRKKPRDTNNFSGLSG